MFSPRWNVFLFCWQKNPLMLLVLSSVQGLEVYCDIHSSGFVNWKICFNRGRSKSKILILAQILIQKYSNQNISSKVCWKIAFLLGRNCRQYFFNVKKVLFHWKGFFNLPHLAQESIKEQAWAKKITQWRNNLKHILCRKPHFDRLENFLPARGQNQVGLPSMNILDAVSLLSHSVASCSALFYFGRCADCFHVPIVGMCR